MRRVQLKINRFLSTTPLIPTKRYIITIPTRDSNHLNRVRSIINRVRREVACYLPGIFVDFIFALIVIRPGAAPRSDAHFTDQISAARSFVLEHACSFPQNVKQYYK